MLVHCNLQGRATTHTETVETEHLREGDTVLIGRGQTLWCPRWEEEGWAARGDCASAKSLTFRLSSSRMAEHVDGHPAKYMNFPAARTCVVILKEANAGVLMPCHWGPVQNKAIRSEATHRFCP